MSSSSPHNILQRRKNAKSKSKHHNNHQQHDRDQLMNSAAVNAAGLGNERLQSDRESNKHHQQTATIAALNIIQTRAHSLCNGSLITPLIDCCRDVNCYLNATACHPYSSSCTVRDNHSPAKDSTNSSRSVSSSRSTPDLETKAASIENSSETSSRTTTTISTSNSTTNLIASTLTKELLQNGKTTTASQSPPSTSSPSPSSSSSVSASAPASASSFTLADNDQSYMLKVHLDLYTWFLFALAFATRFYKITYPRNVVFDELHYVKSVAHYMTNQFFFDTHPPLGKQLIAAVADSVGYKGNFTAANIGSPYSSEFPLFWMRLVPALCGSLLPSAVYSLLKEVGISRRFALLGGLLVIFDNSLLIQSRFILMESMLLLFCTLGIYFLLKFQKTKFLHITWIVYGLASAAFLTFAFSVKYVGFFTYCLAGYLIVKYLWDLLFDATKSSKCTTLLNKKTHKQKLS